MKVSFVQPTENLIHLRAQQALSHICESGFLLIPNERELIRAFLSDELFRDEEPQHYGMICFTELQLHEIAQHAAEYGQ